MLSIDSAHPQKVDGMHRNQWTTYSGFGGRLALESVVAFDRITQRRSLSYIYFSIYMIISVQSRSWIS